MPYVLVFIATVNAVPYALYLLLGSQAAQGQVWALFAWLLPTVWAPTVVALLLTWWADGPAGVRQALRGLRCRRGAGPWLVIAAAVPAVATATAVLVARAAGDGAPFIPLIALPFIVAMQCVTGAVGEELGWRGFLLPRLQAQVGRLPAVWLGAGLWSMWHVPSFFFPGMPQQLVPPLLFLLPVAFTGVFLGLVFTKSGDSVLVAMAAHLSVNITMAIRGAEGGSHTFWWTLLVVYGLVAIGGTAAAQVRVSPGALGTDRASMPVK
jgi:membrane protease YdiL (CAAX protease family)